MDKKITWLREIPKFGGAIVGIVLTAIGGVMVIQTALKLYVFGFETNSYFNAEEQCDPAYFGKGAFPAVRTVDGKMEQETKTPEEIEKCIEKRTETEKKRYLQQKKELMVDGVGFLFVGIFFWLVLHKKKKQ